jgi:nitroreductase
LPTPKKDSKREGGSTILTKSFIKENREASFPNLVKIRRSVRDFSSEKVKHEQILNSIELANNSPSVCNRASWKTYIIADINTINSLLILQGGISGYANNISHLLLIVCDLNRFTGSQERNQPFIDGGLFSMSLMYSLTYFGIASCPLNVNLSLKNENLIRKTLDLPNNEVLIMFIATGSYTDTISVTNSPKESLIEKVKLVP